MTTTQTHPAILALLPVGRTKLALHNGTYTVTSEKHGHYTIKLHTQAKGNLIGKRIFSLLVGPDNENSFRGVAFWDEEREQAHVWKAHRSPKSHLRVDRLNWQRSWSKVEKKIAVLISLMLGDDDGYWAQDGYRVLMEGRCLICNRKLTTPESIDAGIGPVCAGRAA